jgi:hypothetical protein
MQTTREDSRGSATFSVSNHRSDHDHQPQLGEFFALLVQFLMENNSDDYV